MTHPADGTLRRLVDDPAGVPDVDRAHVASCARCTDRLAAAADDAATAGTLLTAASEAAAEPDVDAAWHRLSGALASGSTADVVPLASRRRWRPVVHRPVAAAVAVGVLLAGGGVAAATDWLPIFRTEQVAPVTVSETDLVALPDLSAFGDVTVVDEPEVTGVADAAAAAEATGLAVPAVADLPRGVSGEPTYVVADAMAALFTFSADRAAQAAAASGETLPPPPAGLDGAQFRLTAGPGVAQTWTSDQGAPALVVGRAVAPTADSSGVPFATARDYVLSLPGVPEGLAAQLRSFTGDGTTLPLPVPEGQVSSSTTDVNGASATVFTTPDGTMAGVVWVEDGVVTAVAGSLSTDEVLAVARALR